MSKTKNKILETAQKLFNQKGVAGVRVIDIAYETGISPGNLTYHFKTKQSLVRALFNRMKGIHEESFMNLDLKNPQLTLSRTLEFLQNLISYRFIQRDILELSKLCPEIKEQIRQIVLETIDFNYQGIEALVQAGTIIPEPHHKHYYALARMNWDILNSWMAEQIFLEEKQVDPTQAVKRILDLFYPYLSDRTKEQYMVIRKDVKGWLSAARPVGV